jgi:TonB family protein
MMTLLDSALKSTVILAAAWVVSMLLRRRSADLRHRVWLVALCAVALMPLVLMWMPKSWPAAMHIVAASQIAAGPAQAERAIRAFPWTLSVWALGAAIVAGRLLAGLFRIVRITRRAVARDGALYSSEISTPLTWGSLILVPEETSSEIVIAHERAHIERRDWLWQTGARLVTALYWFHPLVWLAEAALRREAEQAVDDRVLASGVDPAEYAGHLVAIARNLIGAVPAQAVAMLRPGTLEGRVKSILDATRPRVPVGRTASAAMAALAMALVIPLAAFQDSSVHKVGEKGLTPPRVVSKVEPKYTEEARDSKIQGTVTLRCVIDEGGVAENIEVVRSLDPGLDVNAIQAVSQWHFAPGTKDGQPVRVQATIEINFKLQ